MADEKVLDMTKQNGETFVSRASDPVVSNVATPADFAAQYPVPLDTTEILAMCEEISVLQAIPEQMTGLQTYTWREMSSLTYTSGSQYIAFTDGACPEEYKHDGDNFTVYLRNIGVKKSLTISDIKHSAAVAAADWNGINKILGGNPGSAGMPGGNPAATFQMALVADLKAKEVRLGMTLVMNGWDNLLVNGNGTTYPLEFNGIVNWDANRECEFHDNSNDTSSGTFSAATFDRWLSESCAKPTHLFGHPTAIQEVMSAYFQLGFAGSQVVQFAGPGDRMVPGMNFAGMVNTGIGRLTVVADINFPRTANTSGRFSSTVYALRMTHNGEPLIYRLTQIPLSLVDLVPGCTAISFEIWAKTALVIKMCCAQGAYSGFFTGRIASTCSVIG